MSNLKKKKNFERNNVRKSEFGEAAFGNFVFRQKCNRENGIRDFCISAKCPKTQNHSHSRNDARHAAQVKFR